METKASPRNQDLGFLVIPQVGRAVHLSRVNCICEFAATFINRRTTGVFRTLKRRQLDELSRVAIATGWL